MKLVRGTINQDGYLRVELDRDELETIMAGDVIADTERDGTRIVVMQEGQPVPPMTEQDSPNDWPEP
jgi:hypothetical protein